MKNPNVKFPGMFRPLKAQPADLPTQLTACTCTWCIRGLHRGNETCPKCDGKWRRIFQTHDLSGNFSMATEVAA